MGNNGSNYRIDYLDLYGRTSCPNTNDETQAVSNPAFQSIIKSLHPILHFAAGVNVDLKFLNNAKKVITSETSAIIFVGGGLIKYKHQLLCEPILITTVLAEHYNIPIMYSSVGVEGYSFLNIKCKLLRRCLTSPCVKSITTRDDIDCINKKYLNLVDLKAKLVLDPACYLNEYLGTIENNECARRNNIGFGIARAGLFPEYGIDISEEELISFWISLGKEYITKGYTISLFTNGSKDDYYLAKQIYQLIGSNSCKLENRPVSLVELVSILNGCKSIVATRMHSCILAFSYGIPFKTLVWNDKQVFFCKMIKHEDSLIRNLEAYLKKGIRSENRT